MIIEMIRQKMTEKQKKFKRMSNGGKCFSSGMAAAESAAHLLARSALQQKRAKRLPAFLALLGAAGI